MRATNHRKAMKCGVYHTRALGSVICLFMNYYLRFKHIPRSKKSSIYRSSVKVGEELGVSVFELAEINGVLRVIFPVYIENSIMKNFDSTPEGYSNDFSMLWNEFIDNLIPAYLVSGTEICKGSDGEPVIKDIKIIKKLSPFKINLRINKNEKERLGSQS